MEPIHIIGAGLAGSEAAWQIARAGVPVVLHEMRPAVETFAHRTGDCAEMVCSNSFRSDDDVNNAVGQLHWEMRAADGLIMAMADRHRLPAGGALAVDRDAFSAAVTEALEAHPLVAFDRAEVRDLPASGNWIVATGPLTSDAAGELGLAPGTRLRVRGEIRGGFLGREMVHPVVRAVAEGVTGAGRARGDEGVSLDDLVLPQPGDDVEPQRLLVVGERHVRPQASREQGCGRGVDDDRGPGHGGLDDGPREAGVPTGRGDGAVVAEHRAVAGQVVDGADDAGIEPIGRRRCVRRDVGSLARHEGDALLAVRQAPDVPGRVDLRGGGRRGRARHAGRARPG